MSKRALSRQLSKHSSFIEDGRKLMEVLEETGKVEVTTGAIVGAGSRKRVINLQMIGRSAVSIMLISNDGRQSFRASPKKRVPFQEFWDCLTSRIQSAFPTHERRMR